jgi:hypothetical protein
LNIHDLNVDVTKHSMDKIIVEAAQGLADILVDLDPQDVGQPFTDDDSVGSCVEQSEDEQVVRFADQMERDFWPKETGRAVNGRARYLLVLIQKSHFSLPTNRTFGSGAFVKKGRVSPANLAAELALIKVVPSATIFVRS